MQRAHQHATTGPDAVPPGPRTNAERRATTRAAILNATIDALYRFGYAGAASTRIAELSGFTCCAQKNHFDTKANMVAEGLEHVQVEMLDEMKTRLSSVADQ